MRPKPTRRRNPTLYASTSAPPALFADPDAWGFAEAAWRDPVDPDVATLTWHRDRGRDGYMLTLDRHRGVADFAIGEVSYWPRKAPGALPVVWPARFRGARVAFADDGDVLVEPRTLRELGPTQDVFAGMVARLAALPPPRRASVRPNPRRRARASR